MGRKAVDFQPAVHRRPRSPGRGPHRRGRPRLRIHPRTASIRSASWSRAEAVGLGRAALERAAALCQRARRVRPADRPEPGDPASARRMLDGARSRRTDGVQGGLRSTTTAMPCGADGQRRQISRRRSRLQACQTAVMTHGGYGLRQGISRRALFPRKHDPAHRPGQPQLILCFIAEKVLGLPILLGPDSQLYPIECTDQGRSGKEFRASLS